MSSPTSLEHSLLKVSQLHWQVADKIILDDVSFSIKKGQVVGIIGPNGAGKTSLLRCILNHQRDFSGEVYFKNKTVNQYSPKELAKYFALVAQKASPIFELTVFDVVCMGLLPHKNLFSLESDHDRHQIELAIEKVGLSSAIHSPYNVLSGGEQQRVLIARALVQKAEILVLDEPTNHLDVYYQHQILQLVNSLNITVIMTIHDLNLAAHYCQRLLLLNQGKLVADGSPDEVLSPEKMSEVFRLSCQRDQDAMTGAARVTFYMDEPSSNATDGIEIHGENHD